MATDECRDEAQPAPLRNREFVEMAKRVTEWQLPATETDKRNAAIGQYLVDAGEQLGPFNADPVSLARMWERAWNDGHRYSSAHIRRLEETIKRLHVRLDSVVDAARPPMPKNEARTAVDAATDGAPPKAFYEG